MIVILFTGGTISMKFDAAQGGAEPTLSGEEIVAATRGLSDVAPLEVEQWGRHPGPHMTVERNVTLAPMKVLGLSRAEAAAQAAELLDRFGLGEKRADYPDRLSGGQQQRVAIVRALAMRPRLMLLDEVTSALDPELVADVLDVIRELAEGGMTMLIATHEMGFARDIASRVCFLADGQIVEQAPPARLFSEPSDERTRRFLRRITDAGRL